MKAPNLGMDPLVASILERLRAAGSTANVAGMAVNWALRQIGKRNAALREAAMETAAELTASRSRSGRWIGADALRELRAKTR